VHGGRDRLKSKTANMSAIRRRINTEIVFINNSKASVSIKREVLMHYL